MDFLGEFLRRRKILHLMGIDTSSVVLSVFEALKHTPTDKWFLASDIIKQIKVHKPLINVERTVVYKLLARLAERGVIEIVDIDDIPELAGIASRNTRKTVKRRMGLSHTRKVYYYHPERWVGWLDAVIEDVKYLKRKAIEYWMPVTVQ